MRIIGEIQHPILKISIFKMGERISIKFENARYEQTYKLGTDERFQNLEAIRQWVDAEFIAKIQQTFEQMHQNSMAANQRAFPPGTEHLFETII